MDAINFRLRVLGTGTFIINHQTITLFELEVEHAVQGFET